MSSFTPDQMVLDDGGVCEVNLLDTPFMLVDMNVQPAPVSHVVAAGTPETGPEVIGEPTYDALVATIRLRVMNTDNDMAEALTAVQSLAEGVKNALLRDAPGMPLDFTPRDASQPSRLYVMAGAITGLPQSWDGDDIGWYHAAPVVTLTLTCRPFFYGTEVAVGAPTTIANGVASWEDLQIEGHVAAEGRLEFSGDQTVADLIWGAMADETAGAFASTDLDLKSGGANPLQNSSGLTVNDTGNSARSAASMRAYTHEETRTACFFSSNRLGHLHIIGRMRAALDAATPSAPSNTYVRLRYRRGSGGGWQTNDWVKLPFDQFHCMVDLGPVDMTGDGPTNWWGAIEVRGVSTQGWQLYNDYVQILAGERFGRAQVQRATAQQAGVMAADEFDQTAGNLVGKTDSTGQTWVAPSAAWSPVMDAADFAVSGSGTLTRTATSDVVDRGRPDKAGGTGMVSPEVETKVVLGTLAIDDFRGVFLEGDNGATEQRLLRWVVHAINSSTIHFELRGLKGPTGAGTSPKTMSQATRDVTGVSYVVMRLRWIFLSSTSGFAVATAELYDSSDTLLETVRWHTESFNPFNGLHYTSNLYGGVYDERSVATAGTRTYDDFTLRDTDPEPPIGTTTVNAKVTSYGVGRADGSQDASRIYGSRFEIPCSGPDAKPALVQALAFDCNCDEQPQTFKTQNVTPDSDCTLHYTPRYLTPLP